MQSNRLKEGIQPNRLDDLDYEDNFSDLHPLLRPHEAYVEADRCYFCHDAPCVQACPTEIDIPMFIRQIATENPLGSAKTIFEQNILGGMCARVCPTETLCEQACVREEAEGKPVKIGALQRYATDKAIAGNTQFFERAESSGKSVAVVGAGPAGLACAHRLALYGHQVTVLDTNPKAGGLNEYGIASYKTVDGFAQTEVDYITGIGGIDIKNDCALGRDVSLSELVGTYDAVFIGIGLSGVNALGLADDTPVGLEDAVEFIARLRQAGNKAALPIGRRVVVVGGGMTAIDAAVQAKLLGAEEVTICYRRGQESMNASVFEQELATSKGVVIRHWLQPSQLICADGALTGITFEYTATGSSGKLEGTGEMVSLQADQVFSAIGQMLEPPETSDGSHAVELEGGRIKVDASFKTSMDKVWAGGDCVTGGEDLTVTAVANGRDAAEAIHREFSGG